MKLTTEEKQKIIRVLTQVLDGGKCLTRSDILDRAMKEFGFERGELEDISADSDYSTLRSYMGGALTELVRSGDVVRSGDGYRLAEGEPVTVERQDCKQQMLRLLLQKSRTKSELYAALGQHFGTDKTSSVTDDNALKGMAGQILSRLMDDNAVTYENGRYSIMKAEDPASYKKVYTNISEFKRAYINRLHEKGGRFFETFCANLLEKYFQVTGRRVLSCDVKGGSDDGGIDVDMRTMDDLGFLEHVMVQVKCRANVQTSEREIREFFGAMNVGGGTRGIFLTLGSFHNSAEKLLKSIPNCVGIDGEKLFHIALITDYGIVRSDAGYAFDDMIFT